MDNPRHQVEEADAPPRDYPSNLSEDESSRCNPHPKSPADSSSPVAAVASTSSDGSSAGSGTAQDRNNSSALFERLAAGFRAVKLRRDQGPSDAVVPLEGKPDFLSRVLVNVIDPSSAPSVVSPSKARQQPAPPSLQLYDKIESTFVHQYRSQLQQVPYQSPRTGATSVIDSLTVQTVVTRSHGGVLTSVTTRQSTATTADNDNADITTDPSEWHHLPYCHVYLATCESLEQYRTKVKPSIQVFLSQIEANHGNSSTNTSNSSSGSTSTATPPLPGTSSQYVIVFVPTSRMSGQSSAHSREGGTDGSGASSALAPRARISHFASRVAAARQMARETITASVSGGTVTSTASSADAVGDGASPGDSADDGTTGFSDSANLGASATSTGSSSSMAHLSKADKELARRFAVDFPAGNACILSSLLHPVANPDDGEDEDEYASEIRRTEWAQFRGKLGAAIASGFRERCQRYGEALKQLEHLRNLAQQDSVEARVQVLRERRRLDLAYYFLVKESLAFTYQQMNLPSEAVLQYDELRAVLPELNPNDKSHRHDDDALSQAALRGDCLIFRARARATENLTPLAPILQEYLFARTTSLLFEMDKSVEVVGRCTAFIKTMHQYRLLRLDGQDGKEESMSKARLELEFRAFNFCWDIKRACDLYLADDVSESSAAAALQVPEEWPRRSSSHARSSHRRTRRVDEALAKSICSLIEFARLRLFQIGDMTLGGASRNPLRTSADRVWAKELELPWSPWKPGTNQQDESHTEEETEGGVEGVDQGFLASALDSPGAFVTSYLGLLKVLESHNRFSGRLRRAARLCVEIAGLHVLRGDVSKAATALRVASTVYAEDGWDALQFMLLFRLAGYQRQVSTADEYLQTLVLCFSPNMTNATAPPKALDVLLGDLEAVLRSTWVSRKRLTAIPCFDPVMGLEGFKPSGRTGSSRDLLKKMYSVGDKATISISVVSFLPRQVEVDAISLDLVPFQAYVSALEDSTNVKEDELLTVLRVAGPVKLRPGTNEFDMYWVPMFAGQFILGSTTITWKSIRFTYAASELRRPVMRIDVVPSVPSQSAELLPNYLLPGHEQPVALKFHAGTDVVRQGSVKFVCAPGLQLMLRPTSNDSSNAGTWLSSMEAPLPDCAPGRTANIEVLVKCNPAAESRSDVGSHSLHAHVQTHYRPPFPLDSTLSSKEEQYANDHMAEHQIVTAISTLNAKSLTVEGVELIPYAWNRALMEVRIKCNIPASFVLREWEISLPSFLQDVSDDENGGLNKCLRGAHVTADEVFHLSFDCELAIPSASIKDSRLLLVLEDESGNSFQERLPLNVRRPAAADQFHLPRTNEALSIVGIPSCTDGSAGETYMLVYTVEMVEVDGMAARAPGGTPCHYKLIYDPLDWSVSGSVEGPLSKRHDSATISITVVVSPNRPGDIPSFPLLSVFTIHPNAQEDPEFYLEPAKVDASATAGSFYSRPSHSHTAVASPVAGAYSRRS